MSGETSAALKALITKLDRKILRMDRKLAEHRKDRAEAYSLLATLEHNPSIAELQVVPRNPAPHLHQAILLAVREAGDEGCNFTHILGFVTQVGIETSPKSVRATAFRLVKERRLRHDKQTKTYFRTAVGDTKLDVLQAENPVAATATVAIPKKSAAPAARSRARFPKLSLR